MSRDQYNEVDETVPVELGDTESILEQVIDTSRASRLWKILQPFAKTACFL